MHRNRPCQHLTALTKLKTASEYACPECVALGDTWVHLRVCQQCGHVGCCDSRKTSTPPGTTAPPSTRSQHRPSPARRWLWCFVDEEMAEY